MASDRGMVSGGLTRRALVFAAPSLLVPTMVLAAVAPTPGGAEGPFYPVRIPSDDDAAIDRILAHRNAGGGRRPLHHKRPVYLLSICLFC